jgi:hypothetical protein
MPLPPDIEVVRIPELPYATQLSLNDTFVVNQDVDGETRYGKLLDLYSLISTGGAQPLQSSVYSGGTILYIVPLADEGKSIYSNAQIAGEDFNLYLDGRPLIKQIFVNGVGQNSNAEYQVLSAGGFELLTVGDAFVKGQRYELVLFNQINTQGTPQAPSSGALITGKIPVTANLIMTAANHLGKLMQIRGQANKVTLTLPKIEDLPENTIIPIESSINNQFQGIVATQDGQKIYINNKSKTAVYMGKGESLWLYRDTDGYYIINDFGRAYREIGKPYAAFSYEEDENEVICMGQLANRSDYPRLWEKVQTLAGSLVDDTTWGTLSLTTANGQVTEKPYKGCWSTGDGATTFRFPDLRNSTLRGLKDIIGADPERVNGNRAGMFQKHMIEAHDHVQQGGADGGGSFSYVMDNNNTPGGTPTSQHTGQTGGGETRMDNIGIFWVVKV